MYEKVCLIRNVKDLQLRLWLVLNSVNFEKKSHV